MLGGMKEWVIVKRSGRDGRKKKEEKKGKSTIGHMIKVIKQKTAVVFLK